MLSQGEILVGQSAAPTPCEWGCNMVWGDTLYSYRGLCRPVKMLLYGWMAGQLHRL